MQARWERARQLRHSAQRLALLLLFPALMPGILYAQQLPGTLEPAQLERQFEKQRQPTAEPEAPVLADPPIAAPSASAEPITVLRRLIVRDMTVLDENALMPLLERFQDQRISLADAQIMARMLTNEYRNAGYILSRVIVPPQRIEDGALTLQAIEGFIDEVRVSGLKYSKSDLLDRYVSKLQESRPLHADVLERYLLLADSLPGITANAVLRPSTATPGASDLDLVITEERLDGYASFDNRGSRFNGPTQLQLSANLNSLLGLHDRTRLRVIGASEFSELRIVEVAHEQQLGSEGMALQLAGRYTESEPGNVLEDSELESESVSASALLSYPFIRSRARNLFGRMALDFRDTETEILSEEFSEDRISALRAGLAFDFADGWGGINLVDIEVSKGLDLFDASDDGDPLLSRAGADPQFLKANLSMLRLQRLGGGFSALINAEGQYSEDRLVAAEEFALGGGIFGRGFDPSQLSGDKGFAARVELRHDRSLAGGILEGAQLYSFYDYGTVWRKAAGGVSSSKDDLASAGAGWRLYVGASTTATIEVAVPTIGDNVSEGNDDARVLFEISTEF
jgi:hemolysin activation/secretion protein